MPKVNPNAPCPCGSGRKFKRCCGDPRKAPAKRPAPSEDDVPAASEPPKDETASETPYSWPPLDVSSVPQRVLTTREMLHLFSPPARLLLARVADTVNDGSEDAACEGLRLLALIPDEHVHALWGIAEMKVQLLRQAGSHAEAWHEALRFLAARGDETSWVLHGDLLCRWMSRGSDAEARQEIEQDLRSVLDACDNLVPRLMLGVMISFRSEESILDLLEDALFHPIWSTDRKLFDLWRVVAARGFSVAIAELFDTGCDERASKLARRAATLPWRGPLRLHGHTLNGLLASLYAAAPQEMSRVARDLTQGEPAPPEAHLWLALDARDRGDHARAIRHLRKTDGVLVPIGLNCSALANYLVHHDEWELALRIVEQAPDREAPRLLYAEARALLALGRVEDACAVSAKLWALRPKAAQSFLLRNETLHRAGRPEEAEAWLREVMCDADSVHADAARLALARELLGKDRPDASLEVLEPLLELPPRLDHDAGAHAVLGDALTANARHREALVHIERAARLDPSALQSARLALALLEAQRDDDAETEVSLALDLWPDSLPLRVASVSVADARGAWSDALARLDALGDPWAAADTVRRSLVLMKDRALVELGRPMDALMVFEGHLEVVLADDELSGARTETVEEARRRFAQLERDVAREHRRSRAQREASKRETAELRRSAERKRAEISRLLLHQRAETRELTDDDEPWQGVRLPEGLSAQHRKLVQSAERSWVTLARRPDDDHGAIVIQLARAVESLVNQRLVDPLVVRCLREHGSLRVLEPATSGSLRDRDNRLSIGEAVSVLYPTYEQKEADGTVSVVVNPRASEEHRELVGSAWNDVACPTEAGEYLRCGLAADLMALARLRNRAGHAGEPLGREDAARARALVVGTGKRRGILDRLAVCGG